MTINDEKITISSRKFFNLVIYYTVNGQKVKVGIGFAYYVATTD